MNAVRGRLRRQGVLYPGSGYLPRDGFNQQPAVYALAGPTIGWVDEALRHSSKVYFNRLCEEVSTHSGRVVLSAEVLAFFEQAQAELFLERIGFDPASVTVVITARDYGRLLPSVWQQNVKNGSVESFEPYLDSVASLRGRPGVPFWTAFGLPDLVRRWSRIVGPDRVVLVTAPPHGADKNVLWSRFATASALPDALVGYATGRHAADDNVSLTPSQAELLRGMNVVLQAAGRSEDVQRRLRAQLLQIWMNAAPQPGRRHLALPEHLSGDVERWADEDILVLRRLDVRVVGALNDLVPVQQRSGLNARPDAIDLATVRDILALIEHQPQPLPQPAPTRRRPMPRLFIGSRILSGRLTEPGRQNRPTADPRTATQAATETTRWPSLHIDVSSAECSDTSTPG
jgi:hypothetical protein